MICLFESLGIGWKLLIPDTNWNIKRLVYCTHADTNSNDSSVCPSSEKHHIMLDFTIHIDSTPTFLYFDLYLNTAYLVHYVYILIPEVCLQGCGKSMCCRCESRRPVQIGQFGYFFPSVILIKNEHIPQRQWPCTQETIRKKNNFLKKYLLLNYRFNTPTKQLAQYYKFDKTILWWKGVNDMEIFIVAWQMPRWYKCLLINWNKTSFIIQFQTIHIFKTTKFTHRKNDFFGALAQSYWKNIGK